MRYVTDGGTDVAAALEAADLGRVRAVHFEGMSLCEQICVAAEADIFVAGHGSGETLAAHLPKGARVIELGALHVQMSKGEALRCPLIGK